MKTIVELKEKQADILKSGGGSKKDERELKRLRMMILYLEYNFNEGVMTAQYSELERLLTILKERCFEFCKDPFNRALKNPKAVFETMYGVKQLREQKRNLKYLLEK